MAEAPRSHLPEPFVDPLIGLDLVELRAAKIPWVGAIAVHYWFVVVQGDRRDRWEIWQRRGVGGRHWGHLHQNLMAPTSGVGNGGSWCERSWTGAIAARLAQELLASPTTYPHRDRYCYWPGPNSNTYAQWILDRAAVDHDLGPRGLGKSHHRIFPSPTP